MDTLEDYYPLYINRDRSDSESDNEIIISNVSAFNYDNWCCKHDDDLWYFWCMCKEYTENNSLPFLDSLTYPQFTMFCYKNSMNALK